MVRIILGAALAICAVAAPLAQASAQDDSKLVDAVSPQVAGVETGGSWSANKQGGFYRAIVVMGGEGSNFGAHLYLQWLAMDEKSTSATVVSTVPVKEVNAKNLPNASIAIGGEEGKDNGAVIMVDSFDFNTNKDTNLYVQAGQPGSYTILKSAPKGFEGPQGGPEGQAGPPPGGPAPGGKK